MNGLSPRVYTLYFEHDFAKDGGAQGDITLRGDSLPSGAVVFGGILGIETDYTSEGAATLALKLESAQDVLATTAVTSLVQGLMDVVPVHTAATSILTDDEVSVVATVAGADFTAGKLKGALFYVIL